MLCPDCNKTRGDCFKIYANSQSNFVVFKVPREHGNERKCSVCEPEKLSPEECEGCSESIFRYDRTHQKYLRNLVSPYKNNIHI
jgi:hypothetical protein